MTMEARRIVRFEIAYEIEIDSKGGGTSTVGQRPLGKEAAWPPAASGFDPLALRVPVKKFPRHYWDPLGYAFVTIEEFTRTDWRTKITVTSPLASELDYGIKDLVAMGDNRSSLRTVMMPEIVAQADDATGYWQAMLMFNARSHPWTFQTIQMALRVGQFLAMYYKAKFNIPRPSQVSPVIMPWIDVPPHASYPSGHALEGMLISLALANIVPEAEKPLLALANRVGRNRETAGLHYPIDTTTGFNIATAAFPLLMGCPSFAEALAESKKEWDALR